MLDYRFKYVDKKLIVNIQYIVEQIIICVTPTVSINIQFIKSQGNILTYIYKLSTKLYRRLKVGCNLLISLSHFILAAYM